MHNYTFKNWYAGNLEQGFKIAEGFLSLEVELTGRQWMAQGDGGHSKYKDLEGEKHMFLP